LGYAVQAALEFIEAQWLLAKRSQDQHRPFVRNLIEQKTARTIDLVAAVRTDLSQCPIIRCLHVVSSDTPGDFKVRN